MERKEWLSWGKVVLFALVLSVSVRVLLFTPVTVKGESMEPTFESKEKVIVNINGGTLVGYERLDVIVFKAPSGDNYIKRIVGLPGDRIEYRDDHLYVNGDMIDEPYLSANREKLAGIGKLTGDFTVESVPDGQYFVLGDNRRRSIDSRDPSVGFVKEEQILGKVPVVVGPLENMRIIE